MKKLIHEAHRRSLWQVLGIYLMGSWVVLQVVDQLHETTGMPEWVPALALVLLLIGLPMVLATAFVQEGMPGREGQPSGDAETAPAGPADAYATPVGSAADPSMPGTPSAGPSASTATAAAAGPGSSVGAAKLWLQGNVFTWRNAIAGGVAAFALFGVATAGWMVLRSTGVGTAGTLVARGVIEDGERLVLADFSGDSALAVATTAALRVQLAESGIVSLAEPGLVGNVLERMGVEGGPVDLDRAQEVAEREGYKAVVGGSVVGAGGGYILTARVIETATGNELVSVGENIAEATKFLDAVDRLGRKLRERLGESLGSIRSAPKLARATTSSLEALRKYTRAEEAFDDRDLDQTIALLDEAIALDSSFAMAWRKLAVADDDRRVEAATRAYELRDRLTERERYHTVGLYHSYVTENQDEAVTAYRALIQKFPDDATALNNLAVAYLDLGQLDLAAESFGRALDADPYTAHYYYNLIGSLYRVDRSDSARAVLDSFAVAFPDHPNVAWGRFDFAYLDGDVEAAERELAPLLSSEILSLRRAAHVATTSLRLLEGKIEEAVIAWRQSRENATEIDEAAWHAQVDLEVRGDTAAARERLQTAAAELPDSILDEATGRLSWLFYAVGDVERGDRFWERDLVVDSVQWANRPARFRPLDDLSHRFRRELAMGDYEAALEAEREGDRLARRLLPRLDPAVWADDAIPVFEALGESDSVIARYEAWMGRTELIFRHGVDAFQLPRAYERLGQLYDEKGDAENAALYYARFVEMWEDADPELQPRVRAARARLEEIIRERG